MRNLISSISVNRTTGVLLGTLAVCIGLLSCSASPSPDESKSSGSSTGPTDLTEMRSIAKEAYIYGFPLVDGYRIEHAYFVDRSGREFKAPWNEIFNNARVYTPEDKAVQTPNSDTPYSYVGADLRTEPLVFTVPALEKNRYFSVQLVDAYTHNFAYLGSRATGNDGGSFVLAGPNWTEEKPAGVKDVIRSETQLVLAIYRTQLFNPDDLENVKQIQTRYKVQPLSAFLGRPAPSAAPKIDFIKPLTPAEQKTSPEFFNILNFILQFCPTVPSEQDLMTRFSKIGVSAGKKFDWYTFSPEQQKAIQDGMADAWNTFADYKKEADGGKLPVGHNFGTRDFLKNNYLYRMGGAVLGIYGNSKEEAMYPSYRLDADGNPPDGSKRYTIHFAKDQLPPVNAFWSLTMYEQPASLLVANPINRYLINSPMLRNLKREADGGLTIYVQHESPGKDKESNWLPAPQGPFSVVLRLYWPKPEAANGAWTKPPLKVATS